MPNLACKAENGLLERVASLTDILYERNAVLSSLIEKSSSHKGAELAHFSRRCIVPAMADARQVVDELELLVGRDYWPMPTYGDILFYTD